MPSELTLSGATLALAHAVVERADATGHTLATAESLTGGLLGAALTSVPGASAIYRGGLIAYATEVKATLAGVDPVALSRDGAVSATTAEALARDAAQRCGADLGLGLTGVAGPTEQEGHPVGTVFIGWWSGRAGGHRSARFGGDRSEIRAHAVTTALEIALSWLNDPGGGERGRWE